MKIDSKTLSIRASRFGALSALVYVCLIVAGSHPVCYTEGCHAANAFLAVRKDVFLMLTVVYFMVMSRMVALDDGTERSKELISFTALFGLCGEAVFFGRQIFDLHNICAVCVFFGVIVVVSSVSALVFSKRLITSLGVAGVLTAMCLSPVSVKTVKPPVIVSSKSCFYCQRLKSRLKNEKISVSFVPLSKVKGFPKVIGLKSVPFLIEKTEKGYKIVVGEKKILTELGLKPR